MKTVIINNPVFTAYLAAFYTPEFTAQYTVFNTGSQIIKVKTLNRAV